LRQGNGNVGWRADCLGDLGFWAKDQNGWTHMYDFYPQAIIECGTQDAWMTAPVSLEICGTFLRWRDHEKYTADDVKYIFDQSLKWHISSFNAKSSPVPPEWESLVNEWLKRMGYRFVLRRFTYPETVNRNQKLEFTSWWENKGVAPCYEAFPLAIRLYNQKDQRTFMTRAHIPKWLPGDNVYDDAIFIPADMPAGEYEVQLALVDRRTHHPKVLLAIEGRNKEGWYSLGKVVVR
jgi:hypothetical protein